MSSHAQFNHCFGRFKIDSPDSVQKMGEFSDKEILHNSQEQYENPSSKSLTAEQQEAILKEVRKPEYKEKIRDANLLVVKKLIAGSVSEDTHIIQAINSIEELNKTCNTLIKRIREWYGYYFPELEHIIEDNEIFVKRLLQKSKQEFMEEYSLSVSMGPELKQEDLDAILKFARQVNDLYTQRDILVEYVENVMKVYCRNVYDLVGAMIGAKLLEKAGSLRKLAMLPSSTVQLLGAEKALFRHLRNKRARPPKHGYILSHPLVMNSRREDKGNMARMLAAKISIAAKVDYFKGEYIADKLKEDLEKQSIKK